MTEQDKEGARKWFNETDTDKMGTLSEKEIFSGMFNMFDQDKDGHWSLAEIKQIFKQYATYMGRKLREPYEGWEAEVEKAVDHIDEIHGDHYKNLEYESLSFENLISGSIPIT